MSSILGSGGLTIAGKTIVANLLKLIPGAGTLVGGSISGATAGLLTTAFGEAYIQLMIAVYKGEIKASDVGTKAGDKELKNMFRQQIKG